MNPYRISVAFMAYSFFAFAFHSPLQTETTTSRESISEAEVTQNRKNQSEDFLKRIEEKGKSWDYLNCKELSSGTVHGGSRSRIIISMGNRNSDPIKISITGKRVQEIGMNIAEEFSGLLSREVAPTYFVSSNKSTGGSKRGWVSRKWYGDKQIWTGTATQYPGYMAPHKKSFQYEKDGDLEIISTRLFSFGKSNSEHFIGEEKVLTNTVFRFDNQGNAVVIKVEVNDKGERFFKIRGTCGDGFGFSPTYTYRKPSEVDPELQKLMDNVEYSPNPDSL